MFRPNIEEMASLFSNTTIIESSIITSNDHRKPIELAKNIARIFMPFYKPKEWLFFPDNSLGCFVTIRQHVLFYKNN